MEQKQTILQTQKADEFETWLQENLPHIHMEDKNAYRNVNTPITFICAEHGAYITSPRSVKQAKLGCRKCVGKFLRLSYDDFITKAKNIHGERYLYYSEKEAEWNGSMHKVKIYCPICKSDFWQLGKSHLQGKGCLSCVHKAQQLLYCSFIEQAKKVHGERYFYYNEEEAEWNGGNQKVKIYCPICKNDFLQRGSHHLEGQGCPTCNVGAGFDNEKNFLENPDLAKSNCYLYYIKILDVYKIGITNNITQRFAGEQYEILKIRQTTRLFAWRAEQMILWEFEDYKKRNDKIRVGGTECFSSDISQFDNFDEIFYHNFTEHTF